MTDTAPADTATLEIQIQLSAALLEGSDRAKLAEIAANAATNAIADAIR